MLKGNDKKIYDLTEKIDKKIKELETKLGGTNFRPLTTMINSELFGNKNINVLDIGALRELKIWFMLLDKSFGSDTEQNGFPIYAWLKDIDNKIIYRELLMWRKKRAEIEAKYSDETKLSNELNILDSLLSD